MPPADFSSVPTALAQLGRIGDAQRQTLLNQRAKRYWKPAHPFRRKQGYDNQNALTVVGKRVGGATRPSPWPSTIRAGSLEATTSKGGSVISSTTAAGSSAWARESTRTTPNGRSARPRAKLLAGVNALNFTIVATRPSPSDTSRWTDRLGAR